MALDCNVIASDVGGLGAVVNHQKNGLTVLPNDPQSIVWAVNQLFKDPGAARMRRNQALTDINTIYRWESVAPQTAQVYQRVVQERAQTSW
jgi:glycosyltransferase involved in cell wall biosynthesis